MCHVPMTFSMFSQWRHSSISESGRNPIDLLLVPSHGVATSLWFYWIWFFSSFSTSSLASFHPFFLSFFLFFFFKIFIPADGWAMHLQRSGRNFLRIRRFIRTGFIPLSLSFSLTHFIFLYVWPAFFLSLLLLCLCVHTRAGPIYLDIIVEHYRVLLLLLLLLEYTSRRRRLKKKQKKKKWNIIKTDQKEKLLGLFSLAFFFLDFIAGAYGADCEESSLPN